jgi:hypothetical protein
MIYNWKQPALAAILFACALPMLPGCSGDRGTDPSANIASVTVEADSSVISVGHAARVSLTARDLGGEAVTPPRISWVSLTPDVATVSPSGAVNAISTGAAVIEGRIAGLSGRADLTVVAGADEASHDFNDGTVGPYSNEAGLELDFPADPTETGRGNVARFHYQGGNGDRNRSVQFRYPRRWGQPMHFKGEFYIPVSDIALGEITRKLTYWQSHKDYEKYTTNGGLATGRTVVHLAGSNLVVDATYNPAEGTGKSSDDVRTWAIIATGLEGHRWYTLEVLQQMESAIGRADGRLQVWLDGNLIFDKSTMTWSDPAWVGNRSNNVPFEASDIYFERFLVGQQVNWSGNYDEYRYWDNVRFSARGFGGT